MKHFLILTQIEFTNLNVKINKTTFLYEKRSTKNFEILSLSSVDCIPLLDIGLSTYSPLIHFRLLASSSCTDLHSIAWGYSSRTVRLPRSGLHSRTRSPQRVCPFCGWYGPLPVQPANSLSYVDKFGSLPAYCKLNLYILNYIFSSNSSWTVSITMILAFRSNKNIEAFDKRQLPRCIFLFLLALNA